MDLSGEDKHDMVIRLDNIRTLKYLQQYGYGLIEHDWTPNSGGFYQGYGDNIFFSALKRIFGENNVQDFCLQYNYPWERREVKAQIVDFLGCNLRFRARNTSYSFSVIAVKSDLINNSKRRKWLKRMLNTGSPDIDIDYNEYAIFLTKNGFLIYLIEIFTYSEIIANLVTALERFKAVKRETNVTNKELPAVPKIKIELEPHLALLEIIDENGMKSAKQINPLDLVNAIANHAAIPEEIKYPEPMEHISSSGILPHTPDRICTVFNGTTHMVEHEPQLEGTALTFNTKDTITKTRVGVLIPAGKYSYNFYGEVYRVAFPQMLCIYDVKATGDKGKYVLSKCQVFALKKGKVTAETTLYQFPFSNVNSDGSVCFGRNTLPFIECLSELETFFTYFLAMEANNDLYYGEMSQREMVESFSVRDEFDENLLKKSNANIKNYI